MEKKTNYKWNSKQNIPAVVENYSISSKKVTASNNVGAARTQSNNPTAPLGEKSPISVAISSQTPNTIMSGFDENFKSNIKNCKKGISEMKEDLTFFKKDKNT